MRVLSRGSRQRRSAVALGGDIGRAAGQHDAVQSSEQRSAIQHLGGDWKHHWHGLRDLVDSAHVAVKYGMATMPMKLNGVGDDADNWTARW